MKIRKYTRRPFLLLLCVLAVIVAVDPYVPRTLTSWADGTSQAATVPIFYVDARGKSGTEVGIALGDSIKAEFPNIEKKMDSYLYYFTSQDLFDNYAVPRINAIKPNIDQWYRDEVSGLSSRLDLSGTDELGDGKLSSNELWALQLMADIA
jgi:hypothetical protein